jgi:serine/threonine-protein kinase
MTQLGEYQIVDKIAEGGMATVYRGLQKSLNRQVAVKIMSRDLADDPELVKRFDRESVIMARLCHPNIIRVIDKGITAANNAYFVMDYVAGSDLASLVQGGRLSVARKLDIVLQICRALSYAHQNGVIHRDIKPANILIDGDGNAIVSDFGTAQLKHADAFDTGLTKVGTVMGTLAYMSPEQRTDSSNVTTASDIFSFGVVLYELFVGTLPVGRFKSPRDLVPGLPAALDELILDCLEPDPAQRPSADTIRNRLLQLSQGRHLGKQQKEQAKVSIAGFNDQFLLLDVVKDDRYSAVYLYEHRRSRSLMVIKRLGRKQAGLIQSKLLAKLTHPNIVRVLGTGSNQRNYIVVMEYLRGGSLQDRLLRPMPLRQALRLMLEICEALAFAHDNRIVHGNLRPSNVLFDGHGRTKLTDFGLDEHYQQRGGNGNWYNVHCQQRSKTADILAAGTLFYQMLCASLPAGSPPPGQRPESFERLPRGVQKLIESMIATRPRHRYADVGLVIADLKRLQTDPANEQVALKLGRSCGWRLWLGLSTALLAVCAAVFTTWEWLDRPDLWNAAQSAIYGWFDHR